MPTAGVTGLVTSIMAIPTGEDTSVRPKQGHIVLTLIDLFETFLPRGNKTAFVNRTGVRRLTVSYREFSDLSLKMANLLALNGVLPGDRVLLWCPNSSWWAVAYWGIILRGAVAVPVDFMSDRARAESISSLTKSQVVIQSRCKPERMTAARSLLLEDVPCLLEKLSPLDAIARPAPEDMAQLIYTSGTTGNPKGVILTHKNLVTNISQIDRAVPIITPDFRFLSLLPLSHMFEQMGGFFTPLYHGATVVYLRTLKPSAIMEALAEEDIYIIMAVPRLIQLLQTGIERELEQKHLANLFRRLTRLTAGLPNKLRRRLYFPVQQKFGRNFTAFISGGAPLAPATFNFWSSMGFTVLEGYGLTETSPVLCVNTIEQQLAGSVGPPLPGIELKISGNEVLARGENIFPGYYENPAATRDAFTADGWFRTGDIGEINADGWLSVKGREKELIVTGAGINVYPDELEEVLNRRSGVKESCVIGLEKGDGEEVHAVLLLDGSGVKPEEIISQANRNLDALHRITGFSIWSEAEFPKTTTLKIRKFQVKEQIQRGGAGSSTGTSQDALINLIAMVTGTNTAAINDESLLVTDLGLTSINRLELVNLMEQEYRLDIQDSLIGPETKVADLRRFITARNQPAGHNHFRFWTNSAFVRGVRKVGDMLFTYPLFRSFVTLKVHGAYRLTGLNGPVIFIANHLSYFDQPSLMFALPASIRYRTATAAWQEFFFGKYHGLNRIWRKLAYEYGTWFLNLFPLPQSSGFSGSLRFMGRLADSGMNILIFPEGGHSRDGRLQNFQPGLGIIVKELEIPVVPVRIDGTQKILAPTASLPTRGTVTVTFGKPLHFSSGELHEIIAASRQAIEEL